MNTLTRILVLQVSVGLVGCLAEEADIGSMEQEQIGANQIGANQIGANQIGANQIGANSLTNNPAALAALRSVALRSSTFDTTTGHPDLRLQLHNEDSRIVMKYLVSCALTDEQTITWTDPFDGVSYSWTGGYGICPAWNEKFPTTTCQERVSACLMARVNAFGIRVPLSLRGQPLEVDQTATTSKNDRQGNAIASFDKCGTQAFGWGRNCGWKPAYYGSCTPGTSITVGMGASPPQNCSAPPVGSGSGDLMLRICNGKEGCNYGGANVVSYSDDSCGTLLPSATFTCPDTGYFGVMKAAYDSNQAVTGQVGATYPAVFPAGSADAVPAEVFEKTVAANLVASIAPCTGPTSGVTRNCSWTNEYVGKCAPGANVTVGMGAACQAGTLGWSSGDQMLRVCSGIFGCNHNEAIAFNDDNCGGLAPSATFTCPSKGYFSVMKASYSSANKSVGDAQSSAGSWYELPETSIFSYREGAFYGNIFAEGSLNPSINIWVDGAGYTHNVYNHMPLINGTNTAFYGNSHSLMFACFSDVWEDGVTYETKRLCAGPQTAQVCPMVITGACRNTLMQNQPTYRCEVNDAGQGDYDSCYGAGTVYQQPLTVFLNQPCDLFSDGAPACDIRD
jgi:hypothetical protein